MKHPYLSTKTTARDTFTTDRVADHRQQWLMRSRSLWARCRRPMEANRRRMSLRRVLSPMRALWEAPESQYGVVLFGFLMLVLFGLVMWSLNAMGVLP